MTAIIFFIVELLGLRSSPFLASGIDVNEIVWWSAISVACWAHCMIRPRWSTLPARREAINVGSAALGSLLLAAVVAVAQVRPGANAIAWAMRGDSVNVITISRQIYRDGGIAGGIFQGPTPLPFALVTSNLTPGRSGVADGQLLAHDVERYAQVWVFLMATTCLMAGLSIIAGSAGRSTWVTALLAAFASMVPLSWYYLGIQFQSGFQNTTVALVALLATWIVFLRVRRDPIATVSGLVLSGTVLLAVWSPTALVAGALIATCVPAFSRSWRQTSRASRSILAGSAALFVAYLALVTAPDYFQNADFLRRPGAFPALTLATVTVIGGATLLVVLWNRDRPSSASASADRKIASSGAAALVVALGVGTAYFMLQRRSEASLWGYYPQKFSYTVTLLLIVVMLCIITSTLLDRTRRKRFTASVVAAAVVTTLGLLGLTQSDDPRRLAAVPLWSMLNGTMFRTSEALARTVLASSGRANGLDIAWRYPDPYSDNLVNFWWLQTDLPDPNDNRARLFSQREPAREAKDVCAVVRSLGEPMTVHTSDPGAEDELTSACNDLPWTIALDTSRPSLYTGP